MKKAWMVALVLGVASAVALATDVMSVNIVGFAKKTVKPGKFYIMGSNFDTLPGNNTLKDIFGTNTLAQSGNLGLCDVVMMWSPSSLTYIAFAQYEGDFYLAKNQTQFNLGIASNPVVYAGEAFWLAVAASTPMKDVTIMGEVRANTNASVPLVTGFQMVSYPFSTEINIQSTAFATSTGAGKSGNLGLADKIMVWDPDAGYQSYALYTDNAWYKAKNQAEFNLGILATNVLKMSEGFWYEAINTHTWAEPNPYLSNL